MSGRNPRPEDSGKIIVKLVTKAALERGLVDDGDRILVAVSGGKDSTVLAYALAAAKRAIGKDYSLSALHISTDFCACCKKSALAERLADWGIPFEDVFVPVVGRLKPGRAMNCYWCSTQRRTELLKHAIAGGYNKIALGHHLDDIVETFFMNAMDKGELRSMPARIAYRKYPVSLIRPLAYVEERQVVEFAEREGILKTSCTCPFGRNSSRLRMRERVLAMTGGSGDAKRRLLRAMSSGPVDLLVDDTGD